MINNKQFENMQKLAFGKIITEAKKGNLTENTIREKIKELVKSSVDEAKKKKDKPEDVAPQEDVDINIGDLSTEPPVDTMTPEVGNAADINPTVKSIQDSLQKAFASAKELGDAKLVTQIGNTITMLVRDQVLGGGQQAVAESDKKYYKDAEADDAEHIEALEKDMKDDKKLSKNQ
jgi:hypothetical protein